jgi:hypothetical protein
MKESKMLEELLAVLNMCAFEDADNGYERSRPFMGQRHWPTGEAGKESPEYLNYRDLGDAFHFALCEMKQIQPDANCWDLEAVVQNALAYARAMNCGAISAKAAAAALLPGSE